MEDTKPQIQAVNCSCTSSEHLITFSYNPSYKGDEPDLYLHVQLIPRPWYTRLWYAIKYTFGYQCRYGHWEEFLFDEDNAKQVQDILMSYRAERLEYLKQMGISFQNDFTELNTPRKSAEDGIIAGGGL